MFRGVWLYYFALVAVSWAQPTRTTCRNFGGEFTTFEPQDIIGNWTTVYMWSEPKVNMTEIVTISELTAEEQREYTEILKNYSEDKLKLRMLIHDVPSSGSISFFDIVSVMVPTDDQGNVDAWAVDMKTNKDRTPLPKSGIKYDTKWKKSDEFLLMMLCAQSKAFVLASSSTIDEVKLQELVSKVQFQGFNGARVYP